MATLNIPTRTDLANTFSPFLSVDKVIRTALPYRQETKKQKFERKYGMLYTAGSVVAGGGVLYALHRGGKLFSITDFLKKHYIKYQTKTLKKLSEYGFFKRVRYITGTSISYVSQKALEFGNFVGNMNPFKDVAFDRFCKHAKIKPMFDKLTAFFTKSAKKLALSKYERSGEDLLAFKNCLLEIASKTHDTSLAQKLTSFAEQLSQEMQKIVGQNFTTRFDKTVAMLNSTSERKFLASFKRNNAISLLKQIAEKVKECGDFLPAKIMAKEHKSLYEGLMFSKKTISNSILDLYQTLSKSIDDVFYSVPFKNKQLGERYLKIRDLLTEFRAASVHEVKRATVRANLIQELEQAIPEFSQLQNGSEKSEILKSLIELIKTDKKGIVEESVSLCKVLKETNPELYRKLIKARNKFQDSFNEAINFETDKTYRKLLDFSLHSLPTDILTILLGVGGVSYALADNKKTRREKIQSNIEKGIPVLGGIAVSFLSNMRMVASGTGAIFLGLISGIALNRIGKTINHFYWKQEHKKRIEKTV